MFLKRKKELITQFYQSSEGEKILAYGKLFLSQINEQIKSGEIVGFNRDYRFETKDYEFIFRFAQENDAKLEFFIYDRNKRYKFVSIRFYLNEKFFSHEYSYVIFPYKNKILHISIFELRFFSDFLSLIVEISKDRFQELHIPTELIQQIEETSSLSPLESIKETRKMLSENRRSFSKNAFVNVAFTVKTIQQTIPLLDSLPKGKEVEKVIDQFLDVTCREVPQSLSEYIALSSHEREKFEPKLLNHFHRFYLTALEINECLK